MACDQNMRGALLGILGISTPSSGKEGRKHMQLRDLE
jgi:hypothetical protein